MDKTTDPWASWLPCDEEVARAAFGRAEAEEPDYLAPWSVLGGRVTRLPFSKRWQLLEVLVEWKGDDREIYLLDDGSETLWLNGSSHPIHQANDAEGLALTSEHAADYLRYFLYFLRAPEGAFVLIESPKEIVATDYPDEWFEKFKSTEETARLKSRLEKARDGLGPIKAGGIDEQGRFRFEATVAYGEMLARAVFAVKPNGETEMIEDEPRMILEELSAPKCPDLEFPRQPEPEDKPDEEDGPDEPPPPPVDAKPPTPTRSRASAPHLMPVSRPVEPHRDREVTEAVVAILLEEAIRERDANQLLRHFNSETAADQPIERLAKMILGSVPIIVIESDVPFVEDFVLGLLSQANPAVGKGSIGRARAISGDDTKCEIDHREPLVKVHLASFHAYRVLWDPERTAHELAIKDAAVLIGADRFADVPEPLRRVTDLILKFPRIDRKLFPRIFERVFGAKPAAGWQGGDADWTRYLVPADFHAPRRLGLDPDGAVTFLRERVANRLKLVSADSGPRLNELSGMGEARQVAEDLIADVRSAQTGKIPWSAVDRGFLLVGRPGTGKTTLARAIARECGIKFIVASAAGWQSAGYLDAHLRAMRADFSEARRFAPAILFIDELDSIGSREQLAGSNAQYHTEVINALLEQIQGFDASAPVIVIGATNYADKVDPALRRAGRLDQLIQIPLPNIASLEEIFRYYLKPYQDAKEVARDVRVRPLAELAFGLTGADVEFFVRGASRRARRESRKISQADLLAEVTRRPRRADSAPRLDPEAMRRVAIHEAGHAVASLSGSTAGTELTFVTIVPRLDGSLGFVASVPRESVLTRRGMIEELEKVLAGRAAEQIVYGAAEVGVGAGGSSESSDLAVATRIATSLVCQTGLGDDGGLHWTVEPTVPQERQIDALLRKCYRGIVARLEKHRALLDEVARLLMARQEIEGRELRSLVGKFPAVEGATKKATVECRSRPRR